MDCLPIPVLNFCSYFLFYNNIFDAIAENDVNEFITRIITFSSYAVKFYKSIFFDADTNHSMAIFTALSYF